MHHNKINFQSDSRQMLRHKAKPIWCFGQEMINRYCESIPESRKGQDIYRIERYQISLLDPNVESVTFYRLLIENKSSL